MNPCSFQFLLLPWHCCVVTQSTHKKVVQNSTHTMQEKRRVLRLFYAPSHVLSLVYFWPVLFCERRLLPSVVGRVTTEKFHAHPEGRLAKTQLEGVADIVLTLCPINGTLGHARTCFQMVWL